MPRRIGLVVSLAGRDTAPVLADLHRRAALAGYGHIFPADAPPPTLEELTDQWAHWLGPDWDAGRRAFVAGDNGSIVGVVLAGPDPIEASAGHVARLYVAPERWGQRIGTALYDAAIAHLRQSGYADATLWVLERNERARSWYERLGWHATGERKSTYAPAGIDDLRYRLAL